MIPDLNLRDGIRIPADTVKGFLWGGTESGLAWLEQLPLLIEAVCHQHKITNLQAAPQLSMNLVLFGESDIHGPIVLKMAQPNWEVNNEIASMRIYSESGLYARLIDANESAAWQLQARVQPGDMLQTLVQNGDIPDAEATRTAANLMRKSMRPVPAGLAHTFPNLDRWLDSLWKYAESGRDEIPAEQLELALRHGRELARSPEQPMLLHGDFHHGNILRNEDGWSIIDPKGILADASFEVGPFFYNPIGVDRRSDLVDLFDQRLTIFSDVLEIRRLKLWRASLVACVLSDCWSLEDGPVNHAHFDTVTAALMQLPERNIQSGHRI